jgi:hypothetical protein
MARKAAKPRRRKTNPADTPTQESSRQVRVRTADEITNEATAEQLALRIWATTVGEKVLNSMSALMDELLQSHLLDDDDEEADESWLDNQHKREKNLLDEAIAEGLDKYAEIASVSNLPLNSNSDIAGDAKQLKEVLAKCAIGATKFNDKFSRAQLERMVKRDLEARFKRDQKYSAHVREDVPGSDVKEYGSRGRTSSKGTFVKASDYGAGGWLDALLTGGWMRVAKDRIDPVAWSHQYGLERKTERQNWRHRFRITERSGHQSFFELRREELAGSGTTAIRRLMKAGVHVVRRKAVPEALAGFLYFKPKREIIRMSRVGWAQVGDQFTRALALIAALPPSPALRGEEIKLQVALLHPLIHVNRGHATPETKLAAQRAHLLSNKRKRSVSLPKMTSPNGARSAALPRPP